MVPIDLLFHLLFMIGIDCGVFTCMFGDFVSHDCPPVIEQDHINQYRERIALSIMKTCALTRQPNTTLFTDDEDDVEVCSESPPEHASGDEDDVATKNDTTNDVATMPRSDPVEDAYLQRAVAQSLREKHISSSVAVTA